MDATKPAKMIHWASGNTMNVNVVSLVHDVCNMNQKNNIQFRITGHSSIKLLTSLFNLYDILLATTHTYAQYSLFQFSNLITSEVSH